MKISPIHFFFFENIPNTYYYFPTTTQRQIVLVIEQHPICTNVKQYNIILKKIFKHGSVKCINKSCNKLHNLYRKIIGIWFSREKENEFLLPSDNSFSSSHTYNEEIVRMNILFGIHTAFFHLYTLVSNVCCHLIYL